MLAVALGFVSLGSASRAGEAASGTWDDTHVLRSLHPAVKKKIESLREKMAAQGRRIYLMAGARRGGNGQSLHNQALAVDVNIDGMTSPDVAKELRAVGFPCAIPYFNRSGKACFMAHGDLRGTRLAKGPYAAGGDKAGDCPSRAESLTDSCDNSRQSQWRYVR